MMCAALNTRAPAPVDVTKRWNTGKTEIKKKRKAGAFMCVCVCFIFVFGCVKWRRRRSSRRSRRRERKRKQQEKNGVNLEKRKSKKGVSYLKGRRHQTTETTIQSTAELIRGLQHQST